ncbi:hypothetical protein SCMU_14720 [Sinomonas cyclohexanicum]|uniref:Uncharacterized protein n=1 Tax=Sinomonas cyclohexanicum TaxID=322009 RepID=A0ABN6FFJ2_SINCY|nr:hypothetical protein [Corynebacterium cyclohexanicum]BCT75630.1 hypothetical protein SCMU_14720 [Corynebacterium cyclohexanicum]
MTDDEATDEMIDAARASGKLAGVYSWIDDHDILHSPDCRDGKHRSCTGAGWDLTEDIGTDCPCTCHTRSEGGSAR